jgi:hypothetical protein
MYPVTISIGGDLFRSTASPDPAGLVEILWAHALPGDGLEHIAKRVAGGTVDITLFVKAGGPESAYQAAIRICQSAINTCPTLADWRLVEAKRIILLRARADDDIE